MTDLHPVDARLPLDILRASRDCLYEEAGAVIIAQELILHFDEGFSGSSRIHRIVFVLHLNVDRSYPSRLGDVDAVRALADHVPSALRAIGGNAAVLHILKDLLMEVSDAVVVGLVPLTEDLAADDVLPRGAVDHLVEEEFHMIDDVLVESLEVIGGQLFSVLLDGCLYVPCKILFGDEV